MYVKNAAVDWASKEKDMAYFYRLIMIINFNLDKRLLLKET